MTHKYIFTSILKDTQDLQTRLHSRALAPLNVHTSQDYIKQPDKLYSPTSAERKPFIYGQNAQAA